ncbi:MAG: arginase [Halobacteria archaeon]
MTLKIIGVPTDHGANRRGVDMGPSAVRYAELVPSLEKAGVDVEDTGNIPVSTASQLQERGEEKVDEDQVYHLPEVEEVTRKLSDRVAEVIEEGDIPLALGGDHTVAIGSIKGAARAANPGILWFDAHSDINSIKTSPSGNVHGMVFAAALGIDEFEGSEWANAVIEENNIVQIGIRSVDDDERERLRESDITVYTMSDIDRRGIDEITEEALDIATADTESLHVSLDIDWLDPNEAPGVGTPVYGGVTYREAHLAMETVSEYDCNLNSVDLVEVNPILDESNQTAELGVEVLTSLFGKSII